MESWPSKSQLYSGTFAVGHTMDRTWALDCTLYLDMQSGVGVEVCMLPPLCPASLG